MEKCQSQKQRGGRISEVEGGGSPVSEGGILDQCDMNVRICLVKKNST